MCVNSTWEQSRNAELLFQWPLVRRLHSGPETPALMSRLELVSFLLNHNQFTSAYQAAFSSQTLSLSLLLSKQTFTVLDLLSFLFCDVCCFKCCCGLHYLSYLLLSCFCVEKGSSVCQRSEKFFSDSVWKTVTLLSSTSSLHPVLSHRNIHLKHDGKSHSSWPETLYASMHTHMLLCCWDLRVSAVSSIFWRTCKCTNYQKKKKCGAELGAVDWLLYGMWVWHS